MRSCLRVFVNAGISVGARFRRRRSRTEFLFLNLMLALLVPSDPSEALTREQALMAYTTAGGAYCGGSGPAQRTGLRPGFLPPIWPCFSQDVLTVPDVSTARHDEPVDDGRWRSDLRRCDADITFTSRHVRFWVMS